MRGTVVMTCGYNYRAEQMIPFFHSLRLHFSDDIVVFSDIAPEIFDPLVSRYGVRVVRNLPQRFGPAIDRFHWAADFLEKEQEVTSVFFTDLRDVMFQQSPFSLPPRSALELFLEPRRIMDCSMNRKWLAEIYGDEAIAPFIKNGICCVGTTRGTATAMQSYFALMAAEFDRLNQMGLRPFWGWDQAAHNFLAYTDHFADYTLNPSGEGLVQTLFYESRFCFDRIGRLLNKDGGVCPVVHQYDRTMDLFGGAYRRTILGPQPTDKLKQSN
ncbi:MAG: hypothetical protein ACKPB8_01190 [Alphaproteobacteria bacterium]